MRIHKVSSASCNRLLRGLALGCCYMVLGLVIAYSCGLSAKAAEIPTIESEIENTADLEDDTGEYIDDTDTIMDGSATVSGGDSSGPVPAPDEVDTSQTDVGCTCAETLAVLLEVDAASENEVITYTNLEEFEASPATVDRYEYEILKRLEFLQYSQMILIGLIFVLIFKKK